MQIRTLISGAVSAVFLLSGASQASEVYRAEIFRTAYGAPHIKAANYGSLGYGAGYTTAQDNICDIAERLMTLSGQRARYLGPGDNEHNITSDFFYTRLIQTGGLEAKLAGDIPGGFKPSPDARAFVRGYIAGLNRYVRDTGIANLPDQRCRGAAWLRTYSEEDFWRVELADQTPFIAEVVSASPPGAPEIHAEREAPEAAEGLGSNAYALGREITKSGRGVLLGNPHYPWDGTNRFTRLHLMIPGKLNVVGASLMIAPFVGIGHNQWVAWSHTVSTARRYSLFELTLDPNDPTAYMYDGQRIPMKRTLVTIEVRDASGALTKVTRTYYDTRFGPIMESPAYPWTKTRAFALRVAPEDLRVPDEIMKMWTARNVHELAAIMGRFQAIQFNTTAVDAKGEAFYGDLGAIPYVTDAKAESCSISEEARKSWRETRVPVLDGSRSSCDWDSDATAATPGIFPASAEPHIFRWDYTTNSNDSYWLTNANQPLVGYPRVFGEEGTARSLRTRLGLKQIDDRVAGRDGFGPPKFDLKSVEAVLFADRNLGAEMTRDDLVGLCRREESNSHPDLAEACTVLANWDLRENLDSRGAIIFRLFAQNGGLLFKVPFSASDPLNTPNTLDVDNPKVLAALVDAVNELRAQKIPLDAPLGQVQGQQCGNGERIPIHGGPGPEGDFNVIIPLDSSLKPGVGWTKIRHGSSWIMAVEFTDKGPVSQGVLSYSQSANPDSPHACDQTHLYSMKGWDDLRFTEAAVRKDADSHIVLKGH